MPQILRSIGGNLRLVGPLTVANALVNPSFESGSLGWSTVNSLSDNKTTMTTVSDVQAKFGSRSCRIDVASTASVGGRYGLAQQISQAPSPGGTYTFGAWLFLPADLPANTGPWMRVSFYDQSSALISAHTSPLTLGNATVGWVQASYTESSVPDGTYSSSVEVSLIMQAVPTGVQTFYIDGAVWGPGTSNAYVDGDFAGYVWAGTPSASPTLLSTAPDALSFFSDAVHSGTPHFVVS